MPDREKVIKGLELCTNISPDGCLMLCPYKDEKDETYSGFCEQVLKQDALALLKEQDSVKPHYNARTNWYECGACHYSMTSGMHCRGELIPAYKVGFCAKCGMAVMWND